MGFCLIKKASRGLIAPSMFCAIMRKRRNCFPKKPKTNFSKSAFRFCTARDLRWYFSHKAAVLERFAPGKFCH